MRQKNSARLTVLAGPHINASQPGGRLRVARLYQGGLYEYAKAHKWYMAARQVTMNDLYAFDPDSNPRIEEFEDIIAAEFHQPAEGLGFDQSPVAHMWRTMIWPNNFL